MTPTWYFTHNITLQGKASDQSRKFPGDPGIVPIANTREDKEQIYQLAAIWSALK